MNNLFLKMILNMRQEEIMLYDNLLTVSQKNANEVVYFLQLEYEEETSDYPFLAPSFDAEAALWAAKLVYFAAQLVLYRDNQPQELPAFFPDFNGFNSAGTALSIDLSLRFLPHILEQLQRIDSEDPLITILEQKLAQWPYSAIGYQTIELDEIIINQQIKDDCLRQLYANRIIEQKASNYLTIPKLYQQVKASMGMYSTTFWNDFELLQLDK